MSAFARYQPYIDKLAQSALDSHATLAPPKRRAIFKYAKDMSLGWGSTDVSLSTEEKQLIEIIAFGSNEISDGFVSALKNAGLSEEEILEIMYCAALAAGIARLEKAKEIIAG